MGWVRFRRRGGLRLALRQAFLLGISVCFLFGIQIRDLMSPPSDVTNESRLGARHREKNGLLQSSSRRRLLSEPDAYNNAGNGSATNDSEEQCTPAAYHEFPRDVFTSTQRAQGAIIIHCLVLAYMFVALAIVCDDYFVASLDRICEKLHLSADVAGATFMAAGSSAPELFTSIIGVFVTRGDVGVGTIVGSAVFNILFVVGICALLAGQVVPLSHWPLIRDCTFYSVSVIILIAVISDSFVKWYESAIMLFVYLLYILVMRFNSTIYSWLSNKIGAYLGWGEETHSILPREKDISFHGSYERFNDDIDDTEDPKSPRLYDVIHVDDYVAKSKVKWSFAAFVFRFLIQKRFRTKTRFINAVRLVVLQRRALLMDAAFLKRHRFKHLTYASTLSAYSNRALKNSLQTCLTIDEAEEEDTSDEWRTLPPKGTDWWCYITWGLVYPLRTLLYYTIPDCRKKRWERWFMLTFTVSIIWIAMFSYMMVWMMTLVGFTLHIPDSIMGITFIAAGTSIPDAMASIIVARQGLGDMAVSNTIGSNVFDVLIGLAFPWFLKTAMIHAGSMVHINSNGLVFAVVLLFLTVIVTIAAIHFVGWVLNKKLGIICICVYCLFLTFAIMIEFNVFGYVNPPTCTE